MGRRHGENTILRFRVFHLQKSLWLFTSPRRNHKPETSEKFSKHGFSFFNLNIPFSLKTWPKFQIGWLLYQNSHLALNTHFELEIQKKFQGMNKSTLSQLSLQKCCFDKKYWLNFLKFPFPNRYRRPETRTNLEPKTKFPILGHPTSISICPEWIPAPKAKIISLLQPGRILAHFPLIVGQHHS